MDRDSASPWIWPEPGPPSFHTNPFRTCVIHHCLHTHFEASKIVIWGCRSSHCLQVVRIRDVVYECHLNNIPCETVRRHTCSGKSLGIVRCRGSVIRVSARVCCGASISQFVSAYVTFHKRNPRVYGGISSWWPLPYGVIVIGLTVWEPQDNLELVLLFLHITCTCSHVILGPMS